MKLWRDEPTEENFWGMVVSYAGVGFKTYSGLPFSYEIKKGRNGEYTKELWIDRREKSKSLAWSSVLLALAVVPCAEEESASVEWARVNKQGKWVNKNITSVDFVENLYHLMGWNRECRYKVLGRVAASDRGLILVFEMEEAIMFAPKKEEFVDPVTGETKKRQVKYYPDAYKNRIGRSYTEYEQYRQLNLFEDFGNYNKEQQPEHENSIGNNTEGTEAPMGARSRVLAFPTGFGI